LAIYRIGELTPVIHETAFVADNATVVGDVAIGDDASVWFGASIRADNAPITIGSASNIQENAVLHTDPGFPMSIESNVTIGHQAMLHGCTIKEGTLVGIQAIVLNGAVIGRNCIVGAGSVVTEGKIFPDNCLIFGAPAKVVRELTDEQVAKVSKAAKSYSEKRKRFKTELVRIG
jgi:carbonic anhydrase/acetyltransferase-like protein (isoleucine patch superfamily)